MQTQDITLDDIDEALTYAAHTTRRDTPWHTWVNQLLDQRNQINNPNNQTNTHT